jgi:tRNA(Ile)-lysidine synthase
MELLDLLAQTAYDELRDPHDDQGLEVKALADLPLATRHRVLRLAALEAGAIASELFHVHVLALAQLVASRGAGGEVQLPGHVTAYLSSGDPSDRGAGRLRFRPTPVQG